MQRGRIQEISENHNKQPQPAAGEQKINQFFSSVNMFCFLVVQFW